MIPTFPNKQRLPNVLNKEQLLKLFDIITEPDLMIACMIATFCGLRKGEVVNLKVSDIDLVKGHLKIVDSKNPKRNKTGYGKDRYNKIPYDLIKPLKLWLEIVGDKRYLFPSTDIPDWHMCDKHMFRKYKGTLERAGLLIFDREDKIGRNLCKYNFHTLRHSYATILWEKTGDIYLVKKALGHVDLGTTMIYTHISDKTFDKKIEQAFNRPLYQATPLNNINNEPTIIGQINDPFKVLQLRFARGEIDIEQYKNMSTELRQNQPTDYIG